MAKKSNISDFTEKARKVHGNKYDYSKVQYVNNSTKVCIICPKHGEFSQTPNNHLRGQGCPECSNDKISQKLSLGLVGFIRKARETHGDKYIYDKVNYLNNTTKVCITCPKHGDFWQIPANHMKGEGCLECAKLKLHDMKSSSLEEFISKAREIHEDKYDYSKTEYTDSHTKVCIICPEHGEFWQSPSNHLRGQGCPECSNSKISQKLSLDLEGFIEKAKEVHGDKYVYNEVVYEGCCSKVRIICPKHGEFWQRAKNHLDGRGCPECGRETQKQKHLGSTDVFIERSKEIHRNKYNYSKVNYVGYDTKVCIICPKHGEFWQTPDAHLHNHGCPKCAYITSKSEEEINNFINNVCHVETKTRERSLLTKRLECDILVPSHKLAIEYNGLYWHTENQGKDKNYHLNKTKLAESKGYHLIHIYEDEWLEHKDIVLNKIRHFLGKDTDRPVIGGRKCLIKTVSKTEAESFLTTYHIQGFVASTTYYGAFYEDKLVGVMTFKQEKPNEWNLTRFATDTSYRLPGLASKIFKQFIKNYSPLEVKTFLDRRWSHGGVNVYDRMGFMLTESLPPDYRYVVKNQRLHKFGFRKQILHKKYGLPLSMTEKEMTEKLGFYRIWDCGLYKYVWKQQIFSNI